MISGSYAFTGGNNRPAFVVPVTDDCPGLRYNPVEAEGFTGGYYLHDSLPLKNDDIYYRDSGSDILVLFSGYIYNRSEIRSEFNLGETDTEPAIAAHMFLREGPGFVKRLNGDFAILILRPGVRRAYLFRDHVGIRPLAWALHGECLVFSSDTRELSRAVANGAGPDTTWLTGFFRYIDYSRTPMKEVSRLMPGHYLECSQEGVRVRRYWDPSKIRTDRKMQYETMLTELSRLLTDAVSLRTDSRFTAGAHVSSGLDSGIVATLTRREYVSQSAFYGYSWSPAEFDTPDIPYDERVLVQSLCRKAGIIPVFAGITPGGFLENIGQLFYNGGFFIEETLARQASGEGTNLIFSGWGGDEFISTGDRGIETDLLRRLRLRTYFQRNPVRPLKRFVMYFLEYTLLPALGILHPAVARSFEKDTKYLRKSFRKSERKALRNFYFHSSRRLMHLRYLRFYHLQDRCETWTVMGYRAGIEYRYPLLDRRIIEFMLRVPSELLCRTGYFRPLLRILGEGVLPDDVRLNNSKKDHVFTAWWDEMMKSSALAVIDEADLWSGNPDLSFIDFSRLKRDIINYRNNTFGLDTRALFKSLVYIKAMFHFSREYRGQ